MEAKASSATTPEEAASLEEAGRKFVVACGLEAGGNRGLFLQAAAESLIGSFSLTPRWRMLSTFL
jgi:nitronate monooxygenase